MEPPVSTIVRLMTENTGGENMSYDKIRKSTQETAANLRLIDDTFFKLAASRKEVCQEIISTLLDDKQLEVLEVTPQAVMAGLNRNLTLDALCRLGDGRICNIEVQKGNQNDDIRRTRFHASLVTANSTKKGTAFCDVPDVIIIYITEYDALKNCQAFTEVRRCQILEDKNIPIEDGERICYANTAIDDNSIKGELLQLFLKKDSFENEKFPAISETVKFFKETKEGMMGMCKLVEDYAKDYAEDYAEDIKEEIAKKLFKRGMDEKDVEEMTGLDVDTIREIKKNI